MSYLKPYLTKYSSTNIKQKKPLFFRKKSWQLSISALLLSTAGLAYATVDTRPNIVLLVVDDAGFSDFSDFGGEASTPNIDALGDAGMTLTNFHVMPNCSPTRSTLLTGVTNHINGMGTMIENVLDHPENPQFDLPGYQGHINKQVVTVATLLKEAGYHTYMVGKWHLGEEEKVHGGQVLFPRGWWPIDRGFEKSAGVLEGGSEHFGSCERAFGHCTRFYINDTVITPDLPATYFSAIDNTDKAIRFINEGRSDDSGDRKPFFLYYADTLVHEPNQVPDEYIKQEYIDLYYQQGWDGMRAERFEKMKELGIFAESLPFPERHETVPAWNDESDPKWQRLMDRVTTPPYNLTWPDIETVDDLKRTLAKKFAVYTGMVEFFDHESGRIIQHIKDIGEYENTVFMFFSDNGGDSRAWDFVDRDLLVRRGVDNSFENIGQRGSFVANGFEWAQVPNTGLFGAKGGVAQGGIRSPLVVVHPEGNIQPGSRSDSLTSVADIAATVLEYAGVSHPTGTGAEPSWESCIGTYNGAPNICPMNGTGLRDLFEGGVANVHENEPIAIEIFGDATSPNKSLLLEREGSLWKVLKLGRRFWGIGANEPWKLFNLTDDPSEANDLSADHPDLFREMILMSNQYEANVDFTWNNSQIVREVPASTTVYYSFEISNTTEVTDVFNLTCQSAWPCALKLPLEMPQGNSMSLTLDPGVTMQVDVMVHVPQFTLGDSNVAHVSVLRDVNLQMSKNETFVTWKEDNSCLNGSNQYFLGDFSDYWANCGAF